MTTTRGAQIAARLLARSKCPLSQAHEQQWLPARWRGANTAYPTPSRRSLHTQHIREAQAAAAAVRPTEETWNPSSDSTNPALSFPCLDAQDAKTVSLQRHSHAIGPEPSYTSGKHLIFHSEAPILLDWGGVLQNFEIAYETWGTLKADRSNAILLHTGLSASSHAHSTALNPQPGWWEKFIGPGAPLDTNKYFVICTNVLGGCYGSTGPSSVDPSDGRRYATRFPILTMDDMVRAQMCLLDGLGIDQLYASVGSSMGGMQSLAVGVHFADRVDKIVSISGCARSHPYSIAMRHTQRQALMMDPKWNRGFYYESIPPHTGMKLAREIATVTYRSGPEWENRFGRQRADPRKPPALCPDFLIETYLDHAGEKFSLEYDPNSLLYISKAMDLFDLGEKHQQQTARRRAENTGKIAHGRSTSSKDDSSCSLLLPQEKYEEQLSPAGLEEPVNHGQSYPPPDLVAGLATLKSHSVLVMGVASDILFPAWQQREIADALRAAGTRTVEHIELGEELSLFGHDTFLLDLKHIGTNIGRFLG